MTLSGQCDFLHTRLTHQVNHCFMPSAPPQQMMDIGYVTSLSIGLQSRLPLIAFPTGLLQQHRLLQSARPCPARIHIIQSPAHYQRLPDTWKHWTSGYDHDSMYQFFVAGNQLPIYPTTAPTQRTSDQYPAPPVIIKSSHGLPH